MNTNKICVWNACIVLLIFTSSTSFKMLTDAQTETGGRLYKNNCQQCHGKDGTRGLMGAKNLRESNFSDSAIINQIENGKGVMPSFRKKFSSLELNLLLMYVKGLRKWKQELTPKFMTTTNFVLLVTATMTALMAGLFYSWTCSVTPGLAQLPDREYISAMQSMNRAIQNPVFFICFIGAVILLPLSAYLKYDQTTMTSFWFLIGATITYIIGVFGLTIFGNVPLNEALNVFRLEEASSREIMLQRSAFEVPWNRLNLIRTVASTLSIVLVIMACLSEKNFRP